MSDTTVDRANQTGNYDFDPCVEINHGEASSGLRASFDGLLQDAPGCSTSIVNGFLTVAKIPRFTYDLENKFQAWHGQTNQHWGISGIKNSHRYNHIERSNQCHP